MIERTFVTLQAESKTPEYLALNPRGEVPVLTDGDVVVHESIAIVAYLEGEFPEPALFGATSAETGLIMRYSVRIQEGSRSLCRIAVNQENVDLVISMS